MAEAGFLTALTPDVLREMQAVDDGVTGVTGVTGVSTNGSIQDLRSLLWSSIDNPESRDLDQVEVAEREAGDSIRLRVGIADVDAFVPKDSATDRFASHNTTSVYTGVQTFPMLPVRLSEDETSLLQGEDHLAVVVDIVVGPDGVVKARSV
jgi:exoribonuclease-2